MCYYGISRYASQAFPHEWHAYMAGNMKANPSLCNCELCACESYKDHVLLSCSSIGGKQAFSITSSVHRSPFQPSSTSLATFTSAPKETWPTVSASSHVSDHGLGFSWSSKPNRPVSKKSLLHSAAGHCIERTHGVQLQYKNWKKRWHQGLFVLWLDFLHEFDYPEHHPKEASPLITTRVLSDVLTSFQLSELIIISSNGVTIGCTWMYIIGGIYIFSAQFPKPIYSSKPIVIPIA